MRVMQSFLMFFYILDQCYEQCPENDLGGFLGQYLLNCGRMVNQWIKLCIMIGKIEMM